MSDALRITGLISGIDTDSTVKKLIEIEQIKVDKAEQEKQYLEWQKEDYREMANVLRGFQDEYFDVLKPATNMAGTGAFNLFAASASSTSAVTLKTSSNSVIGNFSIDSVAQLATKDSYVSGSEVLGDITGTDMGTIADINTQLATNNQMTFTLDGVNKTITLNAAGYADHAALAADMTTKLQEVFTNVDIQVDSNGTDPYQLEFNVYQDGTTTDETGHALVVNGTNEDLLGLVGLTEGQSNAVNASNSLAEVFGRSGTSSLTINGNGFSFAEDATISEVMATINTSDAGVNIQFDPFSDKFTFESTTVGSDSAIEITDTSGLLADFKLQGGSESYTAAANAEFVVNGISTTRSSNTFEINGTTVTLNEIPTEAVTVDVTADTSDTKDLIVKFVDAYNEMISTINTKVGETRDYDYDPLTDDQKEAMTEDEIETWESYARLGTLRNDTLLSGITQSLREAMYESIDGLGISLYDIGIQTSSNYQDAGKLVIDEDKLDTALSERPNEVIELFTKESDTTYNSYTNRGTRNSENGLAQRINDIIKDNIRITRDDNGSKGYLIDKAGFETGTDTTSFMAKKIIEMDDTIDDLLDLLADKEETYYAEFAAMESAMSAYQSQSSWLASQ